MNMLKWFTCSLSIIFSSLILSSCHLLDGNGGGKTIAYLPKPILPNSNNSVALVDREKIEKSYHNALAAAEDPILRQQIMARIADFEMARSEELQLQTGDTAHYFAKPIAQYRELIALQEASGQPVKGVEVDRLRYKLAKALSLDGRTEEAAKVLDRLADSAPASSFIGETQFRRAEKAFSDGDYLAAERHYKSVASDKNNSMQQNARYMQGWAEFKHGDYATALQTFTQVLDPLLAVATQPPQVDAEVKKLSPAQLNIMTDTLHVMSLAFSYLDGPQSIVSLQKAIGDRAYEHLLYRQLGQFYVEKKLFNDAAETYKYYVAQNPQSDLAPQFSIETMAVYELGNFPSLILPAKQEYVRHYGSSGQYWAQRKGAIGVEALAFLHQSLQELAQYEHAQAQAKTKTSSVQEATAAYKRAAAWYRDFVSTFPQDAKNSEMTFLLAECLSESGDTQQAIAAYQQVAYHYKDAARGADAGYSALLLAQQLANTTEPQQSQWQVHATEYALQFAQAYPADARTAAVLTHAAQALLAKGKVTEAIAVAEQVLNLKPPAESALKFTAWLVLGHSQFDARNYAAAETAYWQALPLLPDYLASNAGKAPNAPSQQQLHERIAASIYQQAQSDLAQGQKDQAIAKLLRISDLAPQTDIAIKAQYDAGVYLLEQQKWSDAEKVYTRFRQQNPDHELIASIPAKMVAIYQNQSKWAQAAVELGVMERNSTDPAVKRQALLMGAELYEKSGNKTMAIAQYQRYANEYPKPIAEAIEAQWHLAQLYGENRDVQQRHYWLQRTVDSDLAAGAQRSDRSIYLAASAASELAQASYKDFTSVPLNLPLKQSLQRKRAALDKALKEQEAILKYGVAEFTTQASFRIGEIYAQLSRDLLTSERPQDLDALALEQYDILLEEQAFPFEEKAIQIHQANSQRSWQGIYDPWVKNSFEALAKLLPARYKKSETLVEVSHEIQ